MQTFMPYSSFEASLGCLDPKRLGKQRVEGKQIVNILEGRQVAWKNHPAVKMWEGFVPALKEYVNVSIREWIKRGYKNTMEEYDTSNEQIILPFWINDPLVHYSHRANLLAKDVSYYSQFNWQVDPHSGYFWPDGAVGKKAQEDIAFWLAFKTKN